jgi:hypothetical protein
VDSHPVDNGPEHHGSRGRYGEHHKQRQQQLHPQQALFPYRRVHETLHEPLVITVEKLAGSQDFGVNHRRQKSVSNSHCIGSIKKKNFKIR